MPHLGGADTYRQLRRLNPNARVIVMSGYNEQEVSSLFAGKGVGDFLQKPFTPVELQAKLKQLIDG
jgi:CheY-like chemotaxis protein